MAITSKSFLASTALSQLISLIKSDVYDVLSSKLSSDVSNLQSTIDSITLSATEGDTTGLSYTLYINSVGVGTISIPEDIFLNSSSYDDNTHILTLSFNTAGSDSGLTDIEIDLSELFAAYSAGNGISIDETSTSGTSGSASTISVVIDTDSESYLTVSSSGVKLSGVDNAISNAISDLEDEIDTNITEISSDTVTELWNSVFSDSGDSE